jgi:hypothetical protein
LLCDICAKVQKSDLSVLSVLDAEQFEDTKGVIRICNTKKHMHHNGK